MPGLVVKTTLPPVLNVVGPLAIIVGIGTKLNPAKIAVPNGVVIEILPVAPVPTIAVILVDDTTIKEEAGIPPKLTVVAPVKFTPVIVTVVPATAVDGLMEEIAVTRARAELIVTVSFDLPLSQPC